MVLITPLPTKPGDFPQASGHIIPGEHPRWCWDGGCLPRRKSPAASSPTAKTPGPSMVVPLLQMQAISRKRPTMLCGEMLVTKSSINTHQKKLVWELGMALHWNNSKTAESIKEAKAVCTHSTQEAEILCSTIIKEAKAICAHSTQEAKTLCSMAITEVEAWGPSQADLLQWLHAKSIQCLEEQAIEEESKGQLDFLSACQATLWASPPGTLQHAGSFLPCIAGACADQCPILLAFPKEHPSLNKCLPQWLLPLLCLSIHLDPSGGIPLKT